ncbi:hypothetical protein D3C75_1025020 [compost metagenome]
MDSGWEEAAAAAGNEAACPQNKLHAAVDGVQYFLLRSVGGARYDDVYRRWLLDGLEDEPQAVRENLRTNIHDRIRQKAGISRIFGADRFVDGGCIQQDQSAGRLRFGPTEFLLYFADKGR